MKTILISGASIAGPALAFWLHKYGYQVTIVERAPSIRPGGYAVDFRGTAMQILKKMGLYEVIKEKETRSGKIQLVDKHSRNLADFPDGFTSGELEIMRGDLANILYDATKQHVEYIFDDTITSLTQNDTHVEVTFQKHEKKQFDLVIGADGLHSKVRAITFGEEAQFLHHMGLYVAIFTTPDFLKLGMDGVFYGSLGKRIGVFGAENREARASFYFRSAPVKYNYKDVNEQKAIIKQRFSEEDWHAATLLRMMDNANDFYFDSISQIRMDKWSKGRISLIGDAAHCASPMAGMGTSMAIVGAYILAGELSTHETHEQAFASYESQMRGFVQKAQELATGADWFVPDTKFKQWMSRMFWKILPYTPWKNMMIELPGKVANSIHPKDYAGTPVVTSLK